MPNPADAPVVVLSRPDDLTPAAVDQAAALLQDLVRNGAALGWVEPPGRAEVDALLRDVVGAVAARDAALAFAWSDDRLAGLAYWRRYARPTHRPHADLERLAVGPRHQGRGVGRALLTALVAAAGDAGVEVLTLDLRGDNRAAEQLYASAGFTRYGVLPRFVAVREARYDKVFMALDLRTSEAVTPATR